MKKGKWIGLVAALTIFAASASFAAFADGWGVENGRYYFEENGSRVNSEWRRGSSDQKWRYLDGTGYMLTNNWVYDGNGQYYVDQNGIMAENQWIQTSEDGQVIWYYAGSDGRIVTDKWQQINNVYYFFGDDGRMASGWADEFQYYCDPASGARKTGWQQLEIPSELLDYEKYDEGEYAWFYFDPVSGKKYAARDENCISKNIGGKSYAFDQNGIMQLGWAKFRDATPELTGYKYFAEQEGNGYSVGQAVTNTWYATVGPEEKQTGDVEWFYFNASGYAKAGEEDDYALERIGGKRYLFNEFGNPVYGVRYVKSDSAEDGYDCYYFGDSKQNCSAETGKKTIVDGSGETINCWFSDAGYGYTGVKNNYLYYKGRLQKADSGLRYVRTTVGGKEYVISSSGLVLKNKNRLKDADGNVINISSTGAIEPVDGNFTEQAPMAPAKHED